MNAWLALLKKEMRLTRKFALIGLAIIALLYIPLTIIDYKVNFPAEDIISFLMFLGFVHIFYPLVYVLISLGIESKHIHLWFHNPQSGWRLFLAKFSAGFIYFTGSFVFTLILASITFLLFPEMKLSLGYLLGDAFLQYIEIFFMSLEAVATIAFLWTFYYYLKPISLLLARILVPVVFVLIVFGEIKFGESQLYKVIIEWGAYSPQGILGFVFGEPYELSTIGEYVYSVFMAILFLIAASWLMDKKIEV